MNELKILVDWLNTQIITDDYDVCCKNALASVITYINNLCDHTTIRVGTLWILQNNDAVTGIVRIVSANEHRVICKLINGHMTHYGVSEFKTAYKEFIQ